MTLPQRSTAIKALLLPLAVLPLLVLPGTAQGESRQTLFSCGTDTAEDQGFLDLSGIPEDIDDWVDLRFDQTANGDGHLVYSFPRGGADSRTAFLFSHSDGPEGYLVSIRWKDEGLNYVYYSLAVPPDPAVEGDMGGGEAGLVISKSGRLIERVPCTERPLMFISYMRAAMSCDEANPYGPSACEENPHERAAPLDIETIGVIG